MWNKSLISNTAIGAFIALAGIALGEPPAADSEFVGPAEKPALIRADLRLEKPIIRTGLPVWAEFTLVNLTGELLTLQVPDLPAVDTASEDMGLPIPHVFSGPDFTAITIEDKRGEMLDAQVSMKPRDPVPIVRLAPFGTTGVRLDLTKYYTSLLQRPGKYTLIWRPYGGSVESPPVTVTLLAEQQAVLLTDFGKMTMRFYYNEAPAHVQNFVDLVNQRFYDNLTFHRIVPGGLIQGGDPRGNGKGIRPDGKRVPAEFNKIPFELGTVGMARSEKDPDSASCQFFICLSRQAAFDGQQTAFGYLHGDESFETLRRLAAIPTAGPKDLPRKPVYMRAVSLENVPTRSLDPASKTGTASKPAVVMQKSDKDEPIFPPRNDKVYRLSTRKPQPTETAPAEDTGG